MTTALMNAFARADVTFVRGEGARLWDSQGKEYLDGLSGIGVCALGHAHPAVTKVICEQAQTLTHVSNLFYNDPQNQLANQLCQISGMEKVFFGNSGAEANEAAIKIARKYGRQKNIELPTIIVMENSFHGRTLATVSATGNAKVRQWFEPHVPGFIHVPYNDVNAIAALSDNPDVVAVLVEPTQGEGGVNIPAADYLPQLRALCDSNDWLLMFDEIQTGTGRSGQFCAYQHFNTLPDVATLAKALGNGFPIGACLAQGKAAEVIQPGNHGTTYGGNALACRVAHTVVTTLVEEKLLARVGDLSEKIYTGFNANLAAIAGVKEIRHLGMLFGIELEKPCAELVAQGLNKGIVINVTAGNVVRLLPPYILSDQQADFLVAAVSELISEFIQA